ncbi:MAG: 4Fe-4S dicluster domain-containing protein, partial [Elusimicrobiota bacterium]
VEPVIALVNKRICNGCFDCKSVCPYNAIEEEVDIKTGRKIAKVIESVCHGCGNCTSACRPGAIDLAGFTNEQVFEEVESI